MKLSLGLASRMRGTREGAPSVPWSKGPSPSDPPMFAAPVHNCWGACRSAHLFSIATKGMIASLLLTSQTSSRPLPQKSCVKIEGVASLVRVLSEYGPSLLYRSRGTARSDAAEITARAGERLERSPQKMSAVAEIPSKPSAPGLPSAPG
jgi:hypothetical protein